MLYAHNNGCSIAYQVRGEGPVDLVAVPGFASHLDAAWEEPGLARFQRLLAGHTRLILYDRRGQGLSDRLGSAPTLAEDISDLVAVLDAVDSRRPALFGVSQGGPIAIAFAAATPDRVASLALFGTYARAAAGDGYEIGHGIETLSSFAAAAEGFWGGDDALAVFAPSRADDPAFSRWFARATRAALSPAGAREMLASRTGLDVRDRLDQLAAPALVMHRAGDRVNPVEHGRFLARRIAGAEYLELPGEDHLWWVPEPEQVGRPLLEFVLAAATPGARGLATTKAKEGIR